MPGPGRAARVSPCSTVVGEVEDGPAEAFVRLVSGRLKAPYDKDVTVEGALTLNDLRRVFPGF